MLAGLTAPAIADAWGLAAPFLVATGLLAVVGVAFALLARDRPTPAGAHPPRRQEGLAVFRDDRRAWALTLFYFLAIGFVLLAAVGVPCLLVLAATAGTPAAADEPRR